MRGPIFLSVLALGGCTVGPDYHRPAVPGEEAGWIAAANSAAPAADPWARLDDPELGRLIALARSANLDIKEAEANLRGARAQRREAVAQGLPQAEITGSAQATQLSADGELPLGELPGFQRGFPLYDLGFDASWELDLWGANRRSVEAAGRQVQGEEARTQGVRLEVAAEVVRAYADLRGAQASLADVRRDADTRHAMAELAALLYRAGETARADEANARARAHGTRASVPALEAAVRQSIDELAVLTGNPPESLIAELKVPAVVPAPPDDVAIGLRSEVLRRRPDVRAAEDDLAAATAGIGVAVADLFPRFSLVGGVDQQSRQIGLLTAAGSTAYQIGPSLSWPIFDAGRIRANIHAARARADAATAAYTKAVLSALADSETAANAYIAAQTTVREREAALAATSTALARVRERFGAGEDDRLALLEAESGAANADATLAQARQQQLTAYASLIKVLGE